jgi:hypothetical protein
MQGGTDHTIFVGLLAAGTAIIAALIAAVSADMRQRRQLKHDRRLKDLTELRSVLDEATVAFEETINQVLWLFAGSSTWVVEEKNEEVKAVLERMYRGGFNKDMKRLSDDRDRMILAGRRIAIRIGDDETLYKTYQSAIILVIEVIREVHAEHRRQQAGTSDSEFAPGELSNGLAALRKALVNEAVALVGSRLPES